MIRTLIVDDQNIIRQGIKVLLADSTEIELIDSAENGTVALDKVAAVQPDVVLLDIDLPDIDGLTVAERIGKKFPQIKIIMLSSSENESYVRKAVASNAKGYLLKNVSSQELEWSIKLVHQGYSAFKSELLESFNQTEPNVPAASKTKVKVDEIKLAPPPSSSKHTAATPRQSRNSRETELLVARNQVRQKYSAMRNQRRGLAFHNVNVSRAKKTMMSFEFKLLVFSILFGLGFLVFYALS